MRDCGAKKGKSLQIAFWTNETRIFLMATSSTPAPAATENVLYVVLHGLISLVDNNGTGFIGYALDMGDDHVYRFGNWLDEQEIPKRVDGYAPFDATLLNVDPFPVAQPLLRLDPELNVVLKLNAPPPIRSRNVRAIFRLPRPRAVYHFISGTIQNGSLQGSQQAQDALLKTPKQVSGIRIFEYTFQNFASVALVQTGTDGSAGTLWNCPQPAQIEGKMVSVLHIYDEPLKPFSTDEEIANHNLDEFNLGFGLFGIDMKLTKLPSGIVAAPAQPHIPGLIDGETASLDQRSDSVITMLHRVRGKENLALPGKPGGGTGGQVC